jgi:hypothetical protein
MQQGRFRRDGMMIHHPGAGPNSYVPTLITRGVDWFCLASMAWSWKAPKADTEYSLQVGKGQPICSAQ